MSTDQTVRNQITLAWLYDQLACDEQALLFEHVFGEFAAVTRENAVTAARVGLDIDWLAARILDRAALRIYEAKAFAAWLVFKEMRKDSASFRERRNSARFGPSVRSA